MGTHTVGAYAGIPGAKLALLIDANADVCRGAAEALDVDRWSTSFADALAPDIDIVDISTPNHYHAEQAIAALNAGKHVIIQKPIAPSLDEAEAIVEAARKNGKQAGMYMSYFDNPLFYEIKDIIKRGLLGDVSSVRARAGANSNDFVKPGNWRNSAEKTGGGALIQLALHPLNMAQWLIDQEVTEVMAFSHNRLSPMIGGDDMTVAACSMDGGALAAIEASYSSYEFTLGVYGTNGFVTVSENTRVELKLGGAYEGTHIRYLRPGETEVLRFPYLSVDHVHVENNPYDQHAAFVRAIREGKPAPIPAEIGLRDLRIVKAIYRSARERALVRVADMK